MFLGLGEVQRYWKVNLQFFFLRTQYSLSKYIHKCSVHVTCIRGSKRRFINALDFCFNWTKSVTTYFVLRSNRPMEQKDQKELLKSGERWKETRNSLNYIQCCLLRNNYSIGNFKMRFVLNARRLKRLYSLFRVIHCPAVQTPSRLLHLLRIRSLHRFINRKARSDRFRLLFCI